MPKKSNAVKGSDIKANKPWLRKVGISKYKTESLDKKKTFLIVCEGQTEELYFKAFPVLTADVKPIHQGCSKLSLVDCTKQYLENENYDEVWCVFDMDTKPDEIGQIDDFNNAISTAKKEGFYCAYSNDAFELWFVLHYQFVDQKHHRSFFYKKLSEYWKVNYEKDGKTRNFAKAIYERLLNDSNASQSKAITFAKKLCDNYRVEPPHLQNPVTKVHELVVALNLHLRK